MNSRWQRNKRHSAGHVDDWLMTYADMITLLLCFFVVFLSYTLGDKKNTPPPQQIAIEQPAPEAPKQTNKVEQAELKLPFPEQAPEERPQAVVEPPKEQPVEQQKPEVVAAPIPAPTPPPQQTANTEQKGDRITQIEIDSSAFFGSGSATLSDPGKNILRNVAASLKDDKYKDYVITIEGHTDDTPINTAVFPSNWELSTARASAVVHFFIEQDIPAQKLRAAGYADTFPKVPNRDTSNKPIPDNQAQNRRVVIKLEKIDKMV